MMLPSFSNFQAGECGMAARLLIHDSASRRSPPASSLYPCLEKTACVCRQWQPPTAAGAMRPPAGSTTVPTDSMQRQQQSAGWVERRPPAIPHCSSMLEPLQQQLRAGTKPRRYQFTSPTSLLALPPSYEITLELTGRSPPSSRRPSSTEDKEITGEERGYDWARTRLSSLNTSTTTNLSLLIELF
jgi:hypothetical protein